MRKRLFLAVWGLPGDDAIAPALTASAVSCVFGTVGMPQPRSMVIDPGNGRRSGIKVGHDTRS